MIVSFADVEVEPFFRFGARPKAGWQNVVNVATRKLDMVMRQSGSRIWDRLRTIA